jgi:hypothetical protein
MQPSAKSQAQLAPHAKKLKPSAIYRKKKKHAGGQVCCAHVLVCHSVIHTDLVEVSLMTQIGIALDVSTLLVVNACLVFPFTSTYCCMHV